MTFREFRESGIDYESKYKELLESVPGKGTRVELFLPLTMKNLI